MVDAYNEELFLEYVEGELAHEKRVTFENQMLQDPRLRNLVAQLVLDRHRLRTLPDQTPPAHLMDTVHERLERSMLLGASPHEFESTSRKTSRSFRWRRAVTLGMTAALFVLVAGVFVVTLVQLSSDSPVKKTGAGSLLTSILRPGETSSNLPPSQNIPHQPATTTRAAQLPAKGLPEAATQPATPATAVKDTPPVPTSEALALAMAQQKSAERRAQKLNRSKVPDAILQAVLPEPAEQFVVMTDDLQTARQRLLAWMTAYQVQLLDSRMVSSPGSAVRSASQSGPLDWLQLTDTDDPALVAPPSTAGVNQALSLEAHAKPSATATQPAAKSTSAGAVALANSSGGKAEPAPQAHLIMTLLLPRPMTAPLAAFVKTLPGAQVTRTSRHISTDPGVLPEGKINALPFDRGIGSHLHDSVAAPGIRSTLPAAFAQALIDQPDAHSSGPRSPLQRILGNPDSLPAWLLADPFAAHGRDGASEQPDWMTLHGPVKTPASSQASKTSGDLIVVQVELIQRPSVVAD